METMMPLMRRAAERTAGLVRATGEEQLELPTPCEKFTVRDLINHLEWVADLFTSSARHGERVEQGPYAGDFPERVERTLAAWERPEAWEGVSPAMGLPMPVLARMFLVDMVTHGWDLARATGRAYEPGPEEVAEALAFTEQMVEPGAVARGPVPVPAGPRLRPRAGSPSHGLQQPAP
jgi:uncharacterized protein (TIGR03086 family)